MQTALVCGDGVPKHAAMAGEPVRWRVELPRHAASRYAYWLLATRCAEVQAITQSSHSAISAVFCKSSRFPLMRKALAKAGFCKGLATMRRDRDSNPGCPQGHNGFRDHPVRPLRHLSSRPRKCQPTPPGEPIDGAKVDIFTVFANSAPFYSAVAALATSAPVDQASWRLNPPVLASRSSSSPQM